MDPHNTEIVWIDDDKNMLAEMSPIFEENGFVVHKAPNTSRALRLMSNIKGLKGVLLDRQLADGENGLELLHHIKAHFPRLRVVVFTGHPDIAEHRQALRDGAVFYIQKELTYIPEDPLRRARFFDTLRSIFEEDDDKSMRAPAEQLEIAPLPAVHPAHRPEPEAGEPENLQQQAHDTRQVWHFVGALVVIFGAVLIGVWFLTTYGGVGTFAAAAPVLLLLVILLIVSLMTLLKVVSEKTFGHVVGEILGKVSLRRERAKPTTEGRPQENAGSIASEASTEHPRAGD